ncbi:flagellar biosynthesis protein FlhF [Marinospirillum alkaliphilum]|uniref:Flagellar biosynthesis protein FlhF n=1 Tax=Marinospirillum alkaliphilum DSM 21637 TaxID=1122209 RepID=A0A1K1VCN4_9GAMM|nr:flagellar biosynthesis protein FlhF [Marinospirillum alkaliphilum]SFX22475.1 flagellar biosynthesis protein FlhF [Marinospirillum alkaliphilum DSM 21637]
MRVKRFFGADSRQAMRLVREELGADAVIVSNRKVENGVEIVCALDYDEADNPATFASALKQADQGDALQRELDEARQRILSGARFDTGLSDNAFQKKARMRQLGSLSEGLSPGGYTPAASEDYSPPPLHTGGSAEELAMRAMQSEIQSLRDLVREQLREQDALRNPTEALVRNRLLSAGFSDAYVRRLLKLLVLDPDMDSKAAWRQVLDRLKGEVQTLDEEFIDKGGIVALLGPTGVGKTTTLGKLAARYVLKHGAEGLALVTTDCYRIAAYEQLRTFGRILGVTVRVVDENNALDMTLKSLRNKSLVLIDTAGLNVRDPNLQVQMGLLGSTQARIRRFMVLPATSQARVLLDTYEAYRDAGLNGCVLTKLDEAVNIGEVLGLVLEKRLPVSYVTNGQKIPDDVQLASPTSLIARFARDVERSEEA